MKKVLFTCLYLLMVVSLFATGSWNSLRKAESYVPDRMTIGLGNDKYEYGVSRNDDDQISYSAFVKLEALLWYVYVDGKRHYQSWMA